MDRGRPCSDDRHSAAELDGAERFWIEGPASGVTNIKGAVLLGLWGAFKEHRIEMPFPQREVHIRDLPSGTAIYRVAEPEVAGEEVR